MAKDNTPKNKYEELGEIVLSDYRKIKLAITEYKGVERLDIREVIDTNMSLTNPNFVFTKRGITIPTDLWKKFLNILNKNLKPKVF